MIYLYLWSALAFSATFSSVRSLPVVSQCTKDCGPIPFNITCDVRRKGITPQKLGAHSTMAIVIGFKGFDAFSRPVHRILWKYKPQRKEGQNVPAGRHWDTYERDINWESSNVFLKSLTIRVRDPSCLDNGIYYCNVKVLTKNWMLRLIEGNEKLSFSNC